MSQVAECIGFGQGTATDVTAVSQLERELQGGLTAATKRLDDALEGQRTADSGGTEQLALQQAVEAAAVTRTAHAMCFPALIPAPT